MKRVFLIAIVLIGSTGLPQAQDRPIFPAAAGFQQPPQNGVISGRIMGLDGKPAAGVRVAAALTDENGRITADTLVAIGRTDETGRYRVEDVPPGRYGVIAGAVTLPTFYPGVGDPRSGRIVTVDPGASISGVDFNLVNSPEPPQMLPGGVYFTSASPPPPPVQVQGRVVIEDGRPVPDLSRDLAISFSGTMNISSSSTTGIVISTTSLSAPGGAFLGTTVAGILPGAGAAQTQPATQPSTASSSVFVYSLATAGTVAVLPDGRFTLSAPPGDYTLTVPRIGGRNPRDYFVKSMSFGSVDLLRERLALSAPVSGEIVVTLGLTASISGNVHDDMGQPVEGLMVSLTPPQSPAVLIQWAVTDDQGNFELRGISPGKYSVSGGDSGRVSGDDALPELTVAGSQKQQLEFTLSTSSAGGRKLALTSPKDPL